MDEKMRLHVYDRSGLPLRCLILGNQCNLDIHLSNDRHRKALLLKVPAEYDLVGNWDRVHARSFLCKPADWFETNTTNTLTVLCASAPACRLEPVVLTPLIVDVSTVL